jgi:hypothetical protein
MTARQGQKNAEECWCDCSCLHYNEVRQDIYRIEVAVGFRNRMRQHVTYASLAHHFGTRVETSVVIAPIRIMADEQDAREEQHRYDRDLRSAEEFDKM